MFVGRAELLALIDQLTAPQAQPVTPPLLVLEGCGGSGRSSILAQAQAKWRNRTPSVLVQPPIHGDTEHIAIRPLLTLVMLGLSVGVKGYPVTFPRSLIAQIVINANLPPDTTRAQLRELLTSYRQRPILVAFLNQLVAAALAFAQVQVPGLPATPDATKGLVDAITGRLFSVLPIRRFTWGHAPEWFGHQDQGFTDDHEETLILLSGQARSTVAANRRGVDDLLVSALLADLRHSRARVNSRPPQVLVLLDDGDTPRATAFARSLMRVRQGLEDAGHRRLADPLAVVTTSAGPLAESLKAMTPASVWPEPGPWLRAEVQDLTGDEVRQLARSLDRFTPELTGAAAYRLTRGHPEATELVLGRIKRNRKLVEDLDQLLGEREPDEEEPEREFPLDEHLLRMFVRGLSPYKHVDENTVEALVTLSAARSWREASTLTGLLPPPLEIGSNLYTSPTLWSPAAESDDRHLHPLARYLGLRALAARTDARTGWEGVFRRLRAKIDPGDLAARLHHERMLNGKTAVAGELAALLPERSSREWLELFDAVVATPDPRERQDMASVKGIGQPSTPLGHTTTLLGVVPALERDPCVAKTSDIEALRKLAWFSFLRLAETEGVRDKQPFIDRATRYAQDGQWCW